MPLYADLDLSFDADPATGDMRMVEETAAVSQSVRNLVLTRFYERPFQPPLGSAVSQRLFEPLDSVTEFALAQDIRDVIRLYEPRATLRQVTVYTKRGPNGESLDEHTVVVTVGFTVQNTPQLVTTQIVLTRLR